MRYQDMLAHCGHPAQHVALKRYRLDDGPGLGQRVWECVLGDWQVQILPDRGLDCATASWRGCNLSWLSPSGLTHPAAYDANDSEWLRTYTGGLVTTCGPANFGPPCDDDGEQLGLHGRFHTSPAQQANGRVVWQEDGARILIDGIIDDARLFGRRIRIERSWELSAGGLSLVDRVRNDGYQAVPLCLLYHCNLGWPLLAATSYLEGAVTSTEARDADAAVGIADDPEAWRRFAAPTAGFAAMVYYHRPAVDAAGWAGMAMCNPERDLRCVLRWDASTLPSLTQWRCLDAGAYVCGIEPGTAFVRSRAELRERGELPMIEAGEERVLRLQFSCSPLGR